MRALSIELWGRPVELLPERALFLPASRTLVVADLHLGKAAAMRSLAVPVPAGTTAETLERLRGALDRTGAARVVVVGDLFHSPRGYRDETLATIASFRERHPTPMVLVPGNHDRELDRVATRLGVELAGDRLEEDGLALCHDASCPEQPTICGHLHPAVRVPGVAGRWHRLPCFWRSDLKLVLPAMGAFTGCSMVDPARGDEVWVIAEDRVVGMPVESVPASRV